MLISQFDKFVNRSTREILGSEIEQENLEPMLSTDIVRDVGGVTGVKGEKEVYYRTGNVNLTSADIGALDENNVYNGLDKSEAGCALDARQGKVLKEAIDDKLNKANVYNGLDQTDPGYALDARQGKALKDKMATYTPLLEINSDAPTTATNYPFNENVSKYLFVVIVGAWVSMEYPTAYLVVPSFCWDANGSGDFRLYLNNIPSNAYATLSNRTNAGCAIQCTDARYRLAIYGFMQNS